MILMNVVISFVFQRYCLGVKIESESAYLCEGNIINPPKNCDNMMWFVKKSEGVKIERLGPNFSIKTDRTRNLISFSCMVCDKKRKFIDQEMKDLTFYTTFMINKGNIKIPGIYDTAEKRGTTKFSKETYEFLVGRLRTLFYYLSYDYHQQDIEDFKDKERSYRFIEEESPQRKALLDQMKHIRDYQNKFKNSNHRDTRIKDLEEYYTHERVKEILGDKKALSEAYNDEELKTYSDMCIKLMNEVSKLFQCRYDKNYVIYNGEFDFTMKTTRFLIFIFDFRSDLVEGREKETIKSDDIVFMNSNGGIVYIDNKHLHIYEKSSPHNNYVLVDIDQLEKNRVKTVIIKKFNYRKDIDDKLWYARIKPAN